MEPFKIEGEKMIVDCYAIELYLPAEYMTTGYRGTPYYALLGTKVKFLGVGNIRFFKSEAEMNDPDGIPCYTFGVPMILMSEPSDVDTRTVRFKKNGRPRDSVVLTYLKGDAFLSNVEQIVSTDPLMMVLSRLESGKLDHIPPEHAVSILHDTELMSGVSLRIPSEDLEVFVCERYRDPDKPGRQYRFHTGATDPDSTVSYNSRTDAMQTSTWSGVMFEDINTSLITAVNRKRRGETNTPGAFESIVRGLPMDDYIAEDHPPLEEAPIQSPVDHNDE